MNKFRYRIETLLFPNFSRRENVRSWISELIWPRQKWLTKKVPRHWCDKVELMREVMFEMIVHFVEEEMDIVSWDWDEEVVAGHVTQERSDEVKQQAYDIRKLYHYIKHVRPALLKEIDAAYPPMREDWLQKGDNGHFTVTTTDEENKCYDRVHKLEESLDKQDQQALHKIVDLRPVLWT